MPSSKIINKKIASLKNTRKITRAMKMISATKLRKTQEAMAQTRLYEQELNEFIQRLAGGQSVSHPLYKPHLVVKNVHVLVFTSDRGLCAGFNAYAIKKAVALCKELKGKDIAYTVSFFGKRGFDFFRKKGCPVQEHHAGVINAPNYAAAEKIGSALIDQFLRNQLDEVYLVYNDFKSAISQVPTIKKLLPFDPEKTGKTVQHKDFIFEPSAKEILDAFALRTVKFFIYRTLLISATAEQAARMTAMDSATNNCGDLIDKYTLQRNKMRQAAITKELVEIVSGAESL
ncbi:MAG: ATP synthase F1 subunit gamma [Fibrobacterota bacterium]